MPESKLNVIHGHSLRQVIKEANEVKVTKEEIVHISVQDGAVNLIYYR